MSEIKVVKFPSQMDQRIVAIANAAGIGLMSEDRGLYEIDFPVMCVDAEAIIGLAKVMSDLKVREHQQIEVLTADLLEF